MYRAVSVAWRMLQLAKEKKIKLSNLQLQKLVYIAHGYLLGWKDKPLIEEGVVAWKYGPVIDSIYHSFKEYGSEKINVDNVQELELELNDDSEVTTVIKGVLDLYGQKDAMALVNLTHQKDTPWDYVWNEQGGSSCYSASISDDNIKDHYRKVISSPESIHGL